MTICNSLKWELCCAVLLECLSLLLEAHYLVVLELLTACVDDDRLVCKLKLNVMYIHCVSVLPSQTHSGSVLRVTWAHPEYGQVLATCSFDRTVGVWEEQGVWRALHVDPCTCITSFNVLQLVTRKEQKYTGYVSCKHN